MSQIDDLSPPRDASSGSARQERLAALQRRLGRGASPFPDAAQDPQPFDTNHEKRIEFRRLVDPGIMRPNSKEVALRSLRVNTNVLTIHERTVLPFYSRWRTFLIDLIHNRGELAPRARQPQVSPVQADEHDNQAGYREPQGRPRIRRRGPSKLYYAIFPRAPVLPHILTLGNDADGFPP